MKNIVTCQIKGAFQGVHSGGEAVYDFKKYYYEETYDAQKKEMIKRALMDILSTKATSNDGKRLLCYTAYIASDIGLIEAKTIIEKIAAEENMKRHQYYGKIKSALEKYNVK